MSQPRVSRQQAELLEILNGTDYFGSIGKYAYELTLDEAARWLREVKGWHVYAVIENECDGICHYYPTIQEVNGGDFLEPSYLDGDYTHDLALSLGIDIILNKLNNNI